MRIQNLKEVGNFNSLPSTNINKRSLLIIITTTYKTKRKNWCGNKQNQMTKYKGMKRHQKESKTHEVLTRATRSN